MVFGIGMASLFSDTKRCPVALKTRHETAKIVEEQYINKTREVFVRAAVKPQTQRFAQLAEKGLIESPLSCLRQS